MDHESKWNQEVARILRERYNVSWTKGLAAFGGSDNLHNHYRVCNMSLTTVWRMYKAVHPHGKKGF